MLEFDKSQIEALKEYLYYSYVHDANIETISYDRGKKIFEIRIFNPIYKSKINLIFEGVKIILSISGNELGNYNTILSLTAEEDFSYIQNCTKIYGDYFVDSLYLLFQMFSGDELHIVAKNVFVEDEQTENTGDGFLC